MSEYFVPAGSGEAEFVEKRSSFLGHVRFVETEDAARDFINEMKKKHYDARHNCWCYILRGGAKRYSDDGEPQGTAGQQDCRCSRCSNARALKTSCASSRGISAAFCSERADCCAHTRKAQRTRWTRPVSPPCAAG